MFFSLRHKKGASRPAMTLLLILVQVQSITAMVLMSDGFYKGYTILPNTTSESPMHPLVSKAKSITP